MNTEELKKHYETLFEYFSDPFRQGSEETIYDRIIDLFEEEDKYLGDLTDQKYKESFEEGEKAIDNFHHFTQGIMNAAFSYGYVIGRLLDPAWGEVKEAEEAILNDIKENELLVYLPREKKEGP
jgi:hypothetical protein